MEAIKKVSEAVGQATQIIKNNLDDFSEKNDLKGKSEQAKAKIIHKYAEATGRNAVVDQTILKYSAAATVTAVGISIAPAVLIGSAAAVAIALPAKSMIQKNYKVVTGRDVGADINEAKSDIQNLSSEVKQSFKQGRQQEDRRTPKQNNQVEYDQHGIQIEGQIQYDQQRKITNQIQYDQCNQQEHQMGEDLPQYQPFQPGQFEKEEETGQYDQQEIQYSQQGHYYQPENDGWNKK